MNDNTLSATDNNEELDFADLADAVASGNSADLDRLMGKEPEKEEEEIEVESVEDDADNEGDKPQEVVEENTDEAATAASTATDNKEVDELSELKNELHRLKSDAGRVPYLQRRMQEMDRELRAYKARVAAAESIQPGDQPNANPTLPEKVKKRIEALREIDPDLAETLEEMHTSLAQEARGAKAAVEVLQTHDQEEQDRQFFMEQKQELLRAIPQADDLFKRPEWKMWKEQTTPGRRALTETGYAQDMVQAIYAFAADMQQLHGNNGQASKSQANSEGGDPLNTSAQQQQTPSVVKENRERKVQVAAEIKSPAAKASVAFDNETAFQEQYAKALKDMNIR